MSKANQTVQFYQYNSGKWGVVDSEAIVEALVSLTVNGEIWLTFMCTPVELEAMAIGFLFNEGIIHSGAEIASVRVCPTRDNVDVWLNDPVQKPTHWRRTSGCTGGVTGVWSDQASETTNAPVIDNNAMLSPSEIFDLIAQLIDAQDLYRKSGGVHTTALSDGQRIHVVAEDIGRHNTLDKIAGRCLLEGISPQRRILVTTGRISSEMLQKAARLGAAVIISRTSPSSLSIQMAEKWGMTLVGYARRNRFNVYTHPERIILDGSSLNTH